MQISHILILKPSRDDHKHEMLVFVSYHHDIHIGMMFHLCDVCILRYLKNGSVNNSFITTNWILLCFGDILLQIRNNNAPNNRIQLEPDSQWL